MPRFYYQHDLGINLDYQKKKKVPRFGRGCICMDLTHNLIENQQRLLQPYEMKLWYSHLMKVIVMVRGSV